ILLWLVLAHLKCSADRQQRWPHLHSRGHKKRRHRVRRGLRTQRSCDWDETHKGGAGLHGLTLEEDGFELAVPPRRERVPAATPGKHCRFGPEPLSGSTFRAAIADWQLRGSGTYGSNPVPSSGESANSRTVCSAACGS